MSSSQARRKRRFDERFVRTKISEKEGRAALDAMLQQEADGQVEDLKPQEKQRSILCPLCSTRCNSRHMIKTDKTPLWGKDNGCVHCRRGDCPFTFPHLVGCKQCSDIYQALENN